jgi:hypothetical protein
MLIYFILSPMYGALALLLKSIWCSEPSVLGTPGVYLMPKERFKVHKTGYCAGLSSRKSSSDAGQEKVVLPSSLAQELAPRLPPKHHLPLSRFATPTGSGRTTPLANGRATPTAGGRATPSSTDGSQPPLYWNSPSTAHQGEISNEF